MPYVSQSQIETAIPAPILTDALDDDRDGVADADVLDNIIASASQAVDALLSARFTVPFAAAIPSAVKEAAFIFSCERIYDRRPGAAEKNPFKERADTWRKRLELVGAGKLPLDAASEAAFTPGAAITSDMATATSSL